MNTTVTQKGQATIPKEVRSYLGLEKGDKVYFKITDQGVLLEKQEADESYNYLKGLQENLSDWDNEEDDRYNEL